MADGAFSPKDFKAWVIEETTTGQVYASPPVVTAPAITSGMFQLDVDSVSFPSLSPNQVTAVRTRSGRVLNDADFFQDNKMKAVEVSLSGTFHADAGTTMLMQSVVGQDLTGSIVNVDLSGTATGVSGKYGQASSAGANKTFTLVLEPSDQVDGFNTVMVGCLCTSFSISAEAGSDGGLYKFEATISSGQKPITNNISAPAGTVFGDGLISLLNATSSGIKVGAITPVLSSFSVSVESPAVYAGFNSAGYHSFGRGAEIIVNASASVKYDSVTKALYNSFNNQTEIIDGNLFVLPNGANNGDCGISIPNGALTEVALNESDIMMLDVSMMGTSDGSASVITFDQTTS